jgi:hypothetical protein
VQREATSTASARIRAITISFDLRRERERVVDRPTPTRTQARRSLMSNSSPATRAASRRAAGVTTFL